MGRTGSCKLGVGKDLERVGGRGVNQERAYQWMNQGSDSGQGGSRKVNEQQYLRTCTLIVMYQNGLFCDSMNQLLNCKSVIGKELRRVTQNLEET